MMYLHWGKKKKKERNQSSQIRLEGLDSINVALYKTSRPLLHLHWKLLTVERIKTMVLVKALSQQFSTGGSRPLW